MVGKSAFALLRDALAAGLKQRVTRRRKRQLVDDHQLQRVTGHIKAFPKRSRGHQHTTRAALRITQTATFAKAFHQTALGALALHQHFHTPLALRLQLLANAAHGVQGGGEHQRSATQNGQGLQHQSGHLSGMSRVTRARQVGRYIQGRLLGIVKRAVHLHDLGRTQATRLGEPAQARLVPQSGRGENPSPLTHATRRPCHGFATRVSRVCGHQGLQRIVIDIRTQGSARVSISGRRK